MLDGRYPSQEFGELRARIVWDRLAGTIRARKGSRQLAVANAGTIPDRGLYAVTLPDGRRVGELDEEMVYEARPGQTFLLGASTLADRGDRARPRDRHAGARGARGGAVLEGRLGRAPEGARRRDRRVLALGRRAGRRRRCSATTTSTSAPRATCSSTSASSSRRRACCRASARSCSSASATRSATGACACSRPTAGACTPPGRSRCPRASASASASRPTRSPPTTGSSCTCPTSTPTISSRCRRPPSWC